jgi:hypothetical protein
LMLTPAMGNAMLDQLDAATWVALHSSFSLSGAGEVSGGNPAYVRQPLTWLPAVDGLKSTQTPAVFDVPASTTISWFGLWSSDAGGTFYGMVPNGGSQSTRPAIYVTDLGTNWLISVAHGLVGGETIVFLPYAGGINPGLTEGFQTYYVVEPTSEDAFQIASLPGSEPIGLPGMGQGYWQRHIPFTMSVQGNFRMNSLTIGIPSVGIT